MSSADPRKLLLSGDWHGNIAFADEVLRHALGLGADAIFQLGDFGYWEHTPDGVRYLDGLAELVQAYSIEHATQLLGLSKGAVHEN